MIFAVGDREPVFEGDGHYIAPTATLIGSVRLLAAASVWFGSVLRADNDWIELGERSNVQDGCILHTDPGIALLVGDDVTIGHRVVLHGCRIGDRSLIGIGSTILNGATIGAECLVGANSLVTEGKSFPDGSLIMGAPARIVRELDDEERTMLRQSATVYVQNADRYRRQLVER